MGMRSNVSRTTLVTRTPPRLDGRPSNSCARGAYHRLAMGDSGETSVAFEATWLDWVKANLGGPPELVQSAADAAKEAIDSGGGLNEAMAAATNRWVERGQGKKPLWEMTFWGVVMSRRTAWVYAL